MSDIPKFEDTEEIIETPSFEDTQPEIEVAEGQTHYIDPETKEALPLPEDVADQSIVGADASLLGVVEGVPFAKDVLSAGQAAYESVTGDIPFGESFAKNKNEWDAAINEAEEKHPLAFNMGDIGSGFAMPLKSIKAMTAFGAASSVSRSEDRDIWDAVSGGALGGTFGYLGQKAGDAINFVGKKLGVISDESVKNILVSNRSKEKVNQHIRKWYVKQGDDLDTGTARFANKVLNKKIDGKFIIEKADTPNNIALKAKSWKESAGKNIDKILSESDKTIEPQKVQSFYNRLRKDLGIDDLLNNPSSDAQAKGTKLLRTLEDEFFEKQQTGVQKLTKEIDTGIIDSSGKPVFRKVEELVPEFSSAPKKLTLKELNNMKKYYASKSNEQVLNGIPVKSDVAQFYGDMTKKISSEIDDLVTTENFLDKYGFKSFRKANREYATASLLEETTRKVADNENLGILDKFQEVLKLRGMVFVAGTVGTAGLASTGSEGAAVTTALGTILYGLSTSRSAAPRFALAARELADNLRNPNYSKYLQKLSVAASLSSNAFRDKLSATMSEIALSNNKVERNLDSVLDKSKELVNIMQDMDPDKGAALQKMLERGNEDEIGAFLTNIEKTTDLSHIISDGIGFAGKVYSEEDKAMLANQLSSANISLSQKLQLKKNLMDNGIIPNIQPEQPVAPKYVPRNKKKPLY